MKTEINGIIVAGKVYEEVPEIDPGRCAGCDFETAEKWRCKLAAGCAAGDTIYRFSPGLTEKLNEG